MKTKAVILPPPPPPPLPLIQHKKGVGGIQIEGIPALVKKKRVLKASSNRKQNMWPLGDVAEIQSTG